MSYHYLAGTEPVKTAGLGVLGYAALLGVGYWLFFSGNRKNPAEHKDPRNSWFAKATGRISDPRQYGDYKKPSARLKRVYARLARKRGKAGARRRKGTNAQWVSLGGHTKRGNKR